MNYDKLIIRLAKTNLCNFIMEEYMGEVIRGILIPFLGTTLGASCVLFMKKMMNKMVQRALTGFAAGIMVSASVWSLLIPSMDYAAEMGKFAFVPAVVGFWIGILFLLAMDHIIPHLHMDTDKAEGPKSKLKKTTMLVFAVTLHNIPEGMAVGVVYAGYLAGNMQISAMGALALAIGIAIQNFPEGAIISMPLHSSGKSKFKSFLGGTLSGIVEPIGAIITIALTRIVVPILPYFLSFAAGAMIYVVSSELIPEAQAEKKSNLVTISVGIGFVIMMLLDVALG